MLVLGGSRDFVTAYSWAYKFAYVVKASKGDIMSRVYKPGYT